MTRSSQTIKPPQNPGRFNEIEYEGLEQTLRQTSPEAENYKALSEKVQRRRAELEAQKSSPLFKKKKFAVAKAVVQERLGEQARQNRDARKRDEETAIWLIIGGLIAAMFAYIVIPERGGWVAALIIVTCGWLSYSLIKE